MLFLARMDVSFPENLSREEKESFKDAERAYSQQLQQTGVMKGIWRVVGEYSNYSIYDAEDNDQLHQIFENFPMFPYMEISVTPLAEHPNKTEFVAY